MPFTPTKKRATTSPTNATWLWARGASQTTSNFTSSDNLAWCANSKVETTGKAIGTSMFARHCCLFLRWRTCNSCRCHGLATLLPSPAKLGLALDAPKQRQIGGRKLGLEVLQDFLNDRSAQYRGGISSPLSAPTACSRLSPYLAFGCVSLREVVQSTYYAIARLTRRKLAKKGLGSLCQPPVLALPFHPKAGVRA